MANPRIYDQLLDEVMSDLDEKGAEVEAEEKKKKKTKSKKKSSKPAPETVPEAAEEMLETTGEDIFGLSNLSLGPKEEYQDYEIRDEKVLPEKENAGRFNRISRKLGESVSEEYVEELKRKHAEPDDGYRATVIFHTRTVLESGDLNDSSSGHQDTHEDVKVEVKTEPEPKKCIIMRLDTGEIYELEGVVTIGREDDNDIVIAEPEGHYVSGFHATIEIDDRGRMMLRDKDSTNGTLVNGTRIGSRYIKPGDAIRFANVDFVVPKK